MSKELENLKTNNATLQAALMSNAQKLAAMGDAETLRKDLEKQRVLRFGNFIKLSFLKINIWFNSDFEKETKELKVKLSAEAEKLNAAMGEADAKLTAAQAAAETAKGSVAALTAQVDELNVSLI